MTVPEFPTLSGTRNWSSPTLDAFSDGGLLHRNCSLADVVAKCRGRLCYLATPYTKTVIDLDGDWNFGASMVSSEVACQWARRLCIEGVTAVSPVIQSVEMVHSDFLDQHLDPLNSVFWTRWCRPLLAASDVVIVPPIAGWDSSDGIWAEVISALGSNREVFLIAHGQDQEIVI